MARPQKIGLDYFPLDNNISDDDKIFYIETKHGITGFGVYIKLLTRIYDNGYYIEWSKFRQNVLARKVNVDINTLLEVVNSCIECYLFDEDMLKNHNILTSKAIQKRYFEATSRRKSVEVLDDYCLVDVNDYNNIKLKEVNVNINPKSVVDNDDIGTQRKEKKRKEEKSKEEDSKENNIQGDFEYLWEMYPSKKGKGNITKSKKKLNFISDNKDELERCINRYKKYVTNERKNGFESLRYMNGSTFFNSGYVDYLDKNYTEEVEVETGKQNLKRGYDSKQETAEYLGYETVEEMEQALKNKNETEEEIKF